jgi:hypothetical protein
VAVSSPSQGQVFGCLVTVSHATRWWRWITGARVGTSTIVEVGIEVQIVTGIVECFIVGVEFGAGIAVAPAATSLLLDLMQIGQVLTFQCECLQSACLPRLLRQGRRGALPQCVHLVPPRRAKVRRGVTLILDAHDSGHGHGHVLGGNVPFVQQSIFAFPSRNNQVFTNATQWRRQPFIVIDRVRFHGGMVRPVQTARDFVVGKAQGERARERRKDLGVSALAPQNKLAQTASSLDHHHCSKGGFLSHTNTYQRGGPDEQDG